MPMTFVFTFSGFRLPSHLYQSVKFCRLTNPDSSIYLIANPELRGHKKLKDLCNIHVVDEKIFDEYRRILDILYIEQSRTQNGFWFKSIERFFLIEAWLETLPAEVGDFIHLESDCLSFVNKDIYLLLREKYNKIAVPVDIMANCIPSIIYFPEAQLALDFSTYIKKRIKSKEKLPEFYCNDISMLNEYRVQNKILDLPSLPNQTSKDLSNVIFDPAFIGEYLFGKDIRHNRFIQQSGYISITNYNQHLRNSKYIIYSDLDNSVNISMLQNRRQYQIANLHNYSKRYDLFNKRQGFKNFVKTIDRINRGNHFPVFKFNHLLHFIYDKIEYNLRVKRDKFK